MKKSAWKNYVFYIAISEAVGLLAGFLIREGTKMYAQTIAKPPLAPPAILFPIVWTILYALMGISAARVSLREASARRKRALYIFAAQLVFNFFWSLIFFNAQAFGVAFFWLLALWALILWMILAFKKIDPLAGYLQIPYLVWVSFAGYLNCGVWLLNK
ncbi:MAG: tryptophan-rich sensory protein [Ruminococcaceae bacterium]|nr:tryptophan-rich sensory protein [Oscillospiraceae bacterium]